MDADTGRKFKAIEATLVNLRDNHLAKIDRRLTRVEGDLSWVKKLSLIILAAVIAGAVATILGG